MIESKYCYGGFITKYFNLEKGARQSDPISAYIFILALEILVFNRDFNRGCLVNMISLEFFKKQMFDKFTAAVSSA